MNLDEDSENILKIIPLLQRHSNRWQSECLSAYRSYRKVIIDLPHGKDTIQLNRTYDNLPFKLRPRIHEQHAGRNLKKRNVFWRSLLGSLYKQLPDFRRIRRRGILQTRLAFPMTCTLEARWFGTPPLPPALLDWFHTLGTVETRTQTDLYLPAEDSALNLKLREGQLQIKRRLAGPLRTSFSTQAAGRCEQWGKWNFDLREGTSSLWEEDPTDLWIAVEKTRHQISIPPEEQSSLSPNLPTTPSATIEVELTTIETGHDTTWTFCFETQGPVPSLADTLMTAAPLLLDDSLPVTLPEDQSFGYIRWLQQLPSVSTRPAPEMQIPRRE